MSISWCACCAVRDTSVEANDARDADLSPTPSRDIVIVVSEGFPKLVFAYVGDRGGNV